jgi:hypothetical protein
MLALEELAAAQRRKDWCSDATLLVILSDGGWSESVSEFREELAKRGGQILLVGIDHEPIGQDVDAIDFVTDIAEVPEVIGGSIVALKARAEARSA